MGVRVVTALDLEEDLAAAVRAGQVRSSLAGVVSQAVNAILAEIAGRETAAQKDAGRGMAQLAAAMAHLRAATDGLFNVSLLIGAMQAARSRSDGLRTELSLTFDELQRVNALSIPSELLPQRARDGFAEAAGREIGGELTTRNILATAVSGITGQHAQHMLGSFTTSRLWALHGQVLASVAAHDGDGATPAEVKSLRDELEAAVRTFRDASLSSMRDLAAGQVAGMAWATRLWLAVDAAETAILDQLSAMAAAAGAATEGEAVARDWAVAYDAARTLLALVAGGWAVLRAYAAHDVDGLTRAAAAAGLRKTPATLDLPRSSLTDIGTVDEGTLVEVGGVVTAMDATVGGPAPRSVLTLGSPTGRQVQILVPFIAVSSFGVQSGVWVQVRGIAYPDGKDDLTGAVVRVGRIQRQQAAAESFHDWLIWEGRDQFELRPGGWDIVAGRKAGTETTAAELGLRR